MQPVYSILLPQLIVQLNSFCGANRLKILNGDSNDCESAQSVESSFSKTTTKVPEMHSSAPSV
jgi:hypothetical protein